MTLIATLKIAGVPILLADILTSWSDETDTPHMPLPTMPVEFLERVVPRSDWKRSFGLARKATPIASNVVLAWAGAAFSAASVIRRLSPNSTSRMEMSVLRGLLSTQSPTSEETACTLIGWVVESDGILGFKWTSDVPKTLITGDRFIEGTGASQFRDLLEQRSSLLDDRFGSGPSVTTRAATLAANMLTKDFATPESIWGLFGSGYEIFTFQNGSFIPIQSSTYFGWTVEVRPGVKNKVSPLPIAIKYSYAEPNLIAQSTRTDGSTPAFDRFIVPPVHLRDVPSEGPPESYESDVYLNMIFLQLPNDIRLTNARAVPSSNTALINTINAPNGTPIGFRFTNKFLNLLRDECISVALEETADADIWLREENKTKMLNILKSHPRMAFHLRIWAEHHIDHANHLKATQILRKALQYYELALRDAPGASDLLHGRALTLVGLVHAGNRDRKDLEEADVASERAIRASAQCWKARFETSKFLIWMATNTECSAEEQRAHLNKAIESLRSCLVQCDEPALVASALGAGLWHLFELDGNIRVLEEAVDNHRIALSLAPQWHEERMQLVMCAIRLIQDNTNARTQLLSEAKTLLAGASEEFRGRATYNLACLSAIEGDEDGCRLLLEKCIGSLDSPSAEDLKNDADFAWLNNREWFRDLLDRF